MTPEIVVGRTTVTLPGLNSTHLAPTAALAGPDNLVRDFLYEDQDLRSLDLTKFHLQDGRINRLTAQSWSLSGTSLSYVEITDATVTSLRWNGSKARRVLFRNCRLMGAEISDLSLDNVIFDNCRLNYAQFSNVRAAGPVAFRNCVLSEASFTGCDLTGGAMRDCIADRTEFGPGKYSDLDLRDTDLSTVRSTAHLHHAIISRAQTDQLTSALLRELEITFGEDLPR